LCLILTGINFQAAPNLATQPPPNIVFILTDDLDLASVEYMPKLKSLLIDRGVSFSNYFVSVSLCCPSRATILRGQYAHNTGVGNNEPINGGFAIFYRRGLEQSTIATWLQAKGYRTAHIGKYLNGYPSVGVGKTYVPPGWDEWNTPVAGTAYLGFNYTINENGKLVTYGNQAKDYGTDVYTRKAEKFIRQAVAEKKPFFVDLSYYVPHQPAISAHRHRNLFPHALAPRTPSYNEIDVSDKPNYIRELGLLNQLQQNHLDRLYQRRLRSLQAVDGSLVTLYYTLKATNQLDNTYIFFTSDNGFHLGQHRLPPGKETAYEEDIHLPLFVWSANLPAGKTIEKIVGNVDLAPTFAELAGATIPDFVDGRSFAKLLHWELKTSDSWRQAFLLEHWLAKTTIPMIPEFSGIRTSSCTYVEYSTGERELYDLKQDPNQLENIASVIKIDAIKYFSQLLSQLRKCRGKSCRQIEARPLPACSS
jgi:arylsulfatase A-like enzyme